MFSRYHGFVYPNSNNKKSNKITNGNNGSGIYFNIDNTSTKKPLSPPPLPSSPPPKLPAASGLPIITIQEEQKNPNNYAYKLPSIKYDDYDNVIERAQTPLQEIKYIPPEVIPKEKQEKRRKTKRKTKRKRETKV